MWIGWWEMRMTWKEFKEVVDNAGFVDEDVIAYIDIDGFADVENLNISESDNGIKIWS